MLELRRFFAISLPQNVVHNHHQGRRTKGLVKLNPPETISCTDDGGTIEVARSVIFFLMEGGYPQANFFGCRHCFIGFSVFCDHVSVF